jgi:hypothetical protein
MKIFKEVKTEPLTPELMAQAWCEFDEIEQACFFNHISAMTENWLPMQLQYVTDCPYLTSKGRMVMSLIGEYSEPSTNQNREKQHDN